jgi:hypothetical protein
MEGDFMRRLFTIAATAAALAVPASVATAGFVEVGTAGAVSAIQCSGVKLTGPLASGTLTFSTSALLAGGNITWSNSGATTTVSFTDNSPGQGACAKNYVEYDATGTVTAASTVGVGIPAVGDTTSGRVCIDIAKNKLKLVPHTTFSL